MHSSACLNGAFVSIDVEKDELRPIWEHVDTRDGPRGNPQDMLVGRIWTAEDWLKQALGFSEA